MGGGCDAGARRDRGLPSFLAQQLTLLELLELLPRQIRDHVEDRHEDREDDAAHHDAHEGDQQRLDEARERLHLRLDLAVVELGDLDRKSVV